MKACLDMLDTCGLYQGFEAEFLQHSTEFYQYLSLSKLEELGVAKYVVFAREVIQAESRLVSHYVSDKNTFLKAVENLEKVLIVAYKTMLLQDFPGVLEMPGCFLTLFQFFKLCGIEREFNFAFKKHVITCAVAIFNKETSSADKMAELYNYKLEVTKLQKEVLQADTLALHIKTAFEEFVNDKSRQNEYAQHLVCHVH
jgi:hypothetical protein